MGETPYFVFLALRQLPDAQERGGEHILGGGGRLSAGALLASHPQGPSRQRWILRIKSCDLMATTTHCGWAIPETRACSQLSKESVGLSLCPPGPSHRGQHHQEI